MGSLSCSSSGLQLHHSLPRPACPHIYLESVLASSVASFSVDFSSFTPDVALLGTNTVLPFHPHSGTQYSSALLSEGGCPHLREQSKTCSPSNEQGCCHNKADSNEGLVRDVPSQCRTQGNGHLQHGWSEAPASAAVLIKPVLPVQRFLMGSRR